jgi:hypothetical protein
MSQTVIEKARFKLLNIGIRLQHTILVKKGNWKTEDFQEVIVSFRLTFNFEPETWLLWGP